jgi:UDP-glucose:(heptosyl)LPS alpha-1,3-glucosyltransferase
MTAELTAQRATPHAGRPVQLAFVIFKYFPYGGIQRDMVRIIRECLALDHRIRLYVMRWEADELPEGLNSEAVTLRLLPQRGLTNPRRYARFAAAVAEDLAAAPVDLVIGMNKMPGLDLYFAGDSCFVDKVSHQRGRWYRLLPRSRHFAEFEAAVFAADRATHIMTIAEAQTPIYQRHYGTQPERLHALPPGIDPSRKALPPAERAALRADFRTEFGIANDERLVLFLGSGFIKKGLDRALEALAALPASQRSRTRLFVVGADNPARFQRQARHAGIEANVRFFAGRDDVPRFLAGADLLLLPAYDELAGMVILEAIIAGLPVLVTANCGYAHYVERADAGQVLAEPFRQAALNDALRQVLADDRTLAHWSAQGIAFGQHADIYRLHRYAARLIDAMVRARREPGVSLAAELTALDAEGTSHD